ncbi:MAG: outer membrane beta-barrel protein [Candidatus Thiodiazotropha sp. 6PLUC2]
MKKSIIGLIAVAGFISTTPQAWADSDWNFLPVMSDGFNPDLTLSVTGGIMDPQTHGLDTDLVFGLELSMNCLLLDPPLGTIRQQFSFSHYDDGGLEITSFEMNPHYLYKVDNKFSIGFGPGIGYVDADGRNVNEGTLALQGGISLHYKMSDQIFLGAEARYQWTKDLDDTKDDLKNARIFGKVGYRF